MFCQATASLVPAIREAYWAPIAAVVVLYPDSMATRKAAYERFLGTIIGSLIGCGAAVCWHQHVVVYGAAVLLAIGLCELLALEAAARLCAVAVTVITIIPHTEPPALVALYRCAEVSYGVACALGYSALVGLVYKEQAGPTLQQ
jgi:uncharacterized membrane protein YgaE (UPF0421/DUF939 family)